MSAEPRRSYRVSVARAASRELEGLPPTIRAKVASVLRALALAPFGQPNTKKLRGDKGFRIRVGDYRILFDVLGDEVTVYAVGNRKDVYR